MPSRTVHPRLEHEMAMVVIAATSLLSLLTVAWTHDPAPLVYTRQGAVTGIRLKERGKLIDAYLGIPYAQPPLAAMRFRRPLPPRPWYDVLNATEFNPGCVQTDLPLGRGAVFNLSGTIEDCLYLNLWTPERTCLTKLKNPCKKLLPVLVYLYGGFFGWGTASAFIFDGVFLAARANVVVVTFNYRVNILGFMNASIPDAPGNMGLYDQVEALRWVRANVEFFGGDPNAVTLVGQSAGAISISYHMMSPMSKGLFHRAVMLSGTPSSLAYVDSIDQNDNFRRIGRSLGCVDYSLPWHLQKEDMVECLRRVDAHRLVDDAMSSLAYRYITVLPSYGDEFLPNNPVENDRIKLNVKEVLLGNTRDEGALFLEVFAAQYGFQIGDVDGLTALVLSIKALFNIKLTESRALANAYIEEDDVENPLAALKGIKNSLDDGGFECPADVFSELAVKNNVTVYRFLFDHRPSWSPWHPSVGATHNDDIVFFLGTLHSDLKAVNETASRDLLAVYRKPPTPDEYRFSDELVQVIGEFCWSGKPKIPKSDMEWPKYTKENKAYVILKPNDYSVAYGPRSKKCHLWEPYLVKRQPSPTTPAPKHKPTPKRVPEKRPGKPLRPLDNFVESSASTGPLSSATALASMLFAIALGRS
ncbi:acetylcholinesterase-1-like isoform X3 [Dermacentor albipictus]|uniref:acetylcholinesterase-1-like isoform X3 n=1 Tax=Dermacentor albipictus TaxID=60249 RepID=UPI0031FE058A